MFCCLFRIIILFVSSAKQQMRICILSIKQKNLIQHFYSINIIALFKQNFSQSP